MSRFSRLPLWRALRLVLLCVWLAGSAAACTLAPDPAPLPPRPLDEDAEERERPDAPGREGLPPPHDEHDVTPPDGLSNALAHLRAMQQADRQIHPGGVARQPWTWLGPTTVAGRLSAIVIHPTAPNIMWVSSPSGGIWKTANAGASWQPLDDFLPSLNVSALVLRPGNPAELFAATGDRGSYGAGIFHSTDGGSSWRQIPATAPSAEQPQWAHVSSLVIAPDGRTLLAATALPWGDQSSAGIWRSVDGGQSWTHALAGAGVMQVRFHPADGRFAVAGSYGRAWSSRDGGATWQAASGLPADANAYNNLALRAELAFAPSDPQIVYASVDRNHGELWKSSDGGRSYALVNTGSGYQRYFDQAGLWVDPTNPAFVVVGGVDAWRSQDGGVTLARITDWTNPSSVHADHRVIVEHPNFGRAGNRSVFFGTDGGLYRATNVTTVQPTAGWQKLDQNLGITQFFGICANPATQTLMGGTLDNGTLRFTGDPAAWSTVAGGDGGDCAIDPSDDSILYGQFQWMNIWRRVGGQPYAENINGSRTYWNGSQWVTTWKAPPYQIPDAVPNAQGQVTSANFLTPLERDPHSPNRLLTGGLSVWRTNSAQAPNTDAQGPAWGAIKPPIPSRETGDDPYWNLVSAIAIAPSDSNIIWVGYNNGTVYKTTNGTAPTPAWQELDTRFPIRPWYQEVRQIVINAQDPDEVYVAFDRYGPNNLWRTTDGGASWSRRVGVGLAGLPESPIHTIAIDPAHPGRVYAGTEVGLFSSADAGGSWCAPEDGPAIVRVERLAWMDDTLVAATFGRGVYRVDPQPTPLTCSVVYAPLIQR